MKLSEYSNTVGVIAPNKFKPKLCSDFAIRTFESFIFFRAKQKRFPYNWVIKLFLHPVNRARNSFGLDTGGSVKCILKVTLNAKSQNCKDVNFQASSLHQTACRPYRFLRIYSYNVHKKSTNKQGSHSVSEANISR